MDFRSCFFAAKHVNFIPDHASVCDSPVCVWPNVWLGFLRLGVIYDSSNGIIYNLLCALSIVSLSHNKLKSPTLFLPTQKHQGNKTVTRRRITKGFVLEQCQMKKSQETITFKQNILLSSGPGPSSGTGQVLGLLQDRSSSSSSKLKELPLFKQ